MLHLAFSWWFCALPSEPYTVREARIHVRHIRDLLKSLDPTDAYNGVDCNSLSFLSIFTDGDLGGMAPRLMFPSPVFKMRDGTVFSPLCGPADSGKRKKRGNELEQIDCTPPEHILPGSKDRPLVPLQPQNKDWKVKEQQLFKHFWGIRSADDWFVSFDRIAK